LLLIGLFGQGAADATWRFGDAFTRSITAGEISILCTLTSSMREHPLAGTAIAAENNVPVFLLSGSK
jgi:hypothetical protein